MATGGVGGQSLLIDDLEDGDATLALVAGRDGGWFTYNDGTANAVQIPSGGVFTPSSPGANGTGYAAATVGSGFATWGAGMGFNFCSDLSAYDISSTVGVSLSYRSDVPVALKLVTRGTQAIEYGGTCDVATTPCYDHYTFWLPASTNWTSLEPRWNDFTQAGWGLQVPLDLTQALGLAFEVGIGSFDYAVDDLYFR
jgi:hypothetical protein